MDDVSFICKRNIEIWLSIRRIVELLSRNCLGLFMIAELLLTRATIGDKIVDKLTFSTSC